MSAMISVKKELQRHRRGELGRATKAAMRAIVIRRYATVGAVENFIREHLARRFSESDTPNIQCLEGWAYFRREPSPAFPRSRHANRQDYARAAAGRDWSR